jgi:hypothetical protein
MTWNPVQGDGRTVVAVRLGDRTELVPLDLATTRGARAASSGDVFEAGTLLV